MILGFSYQILDRFMFYFFQSMKKISRKVDAKVEQGRNDTAFEAKAREGNMLYMIKDTVILPPLYQLIG